MKRSCLGLCLLLGSAFLSSPRPAVAQPVGKSLEGSWRGTLAGKLRLVLTLTKSADGTYGGILDSVDQGATIPIDKVTVGAGKVRLEFSRVGGGYEGALNKDASELQGTWTQGGHGQLLSFVKEKPSTDSKTST